MAVPNEWRIAYMTMLHKKEIRTAVQSSNKWQDAKKIENEYKDLEAEEQAGFRAGRSSMHHLFCLIQAIESKTSFR